MIYKYNLSGTVSNSGKVISSYVSVPQGITNEDLNKSVEAFKRAFNNVNVTVSYTA